MTPTVLSVVQQVAAAQTFQFSGRWRDSPLKWLADIRAPSPRGAAGAEVVLGLLNQHGFSGVKGRFQNTLLVNDLIIRTKTSILWEEEDQFTFQQIRANQPYDVLAMLGVTPANLFLWFCLRDDALQRSKPQHGEESRWIAFPQGEAPSWLLGGEIHEAIADFTLISACIQAVWALGGSA